MLQEFRVAYFGLAVNCLLCDRNFEAFFQYPMALKKMLI